MFPIEDLITETIELYSTHINLKDKKSQLLTALEISQTLPSAINQEYCENSLSNTESEIQNIHSRQQELSEITTEILHPICEVQSIREQIHQSFENLLGGLLLAKKYGIKKSNLNSTNENTTPLIDTPKETNDYPENTTPLIDTPDEINQFIEEFVEFEDFSIDFKTFCLEYNLDINAIANYGFANFIKKINERDRPCYIFSNTKDLEPCTRIYHYRWFKYDIQLQHGGKGPNLKNRWLYNMLHYVFHGDRHNIKPKVQGMGIVNYYHKLLKRETLNKYFQVRLKYRGKIVNQQKKHESPLIDKFLNIDLKPKPALYDLFLTENDKVIENYKKSVTKAQKLLSESINQ